MKLWAAERDLHLNASGVTHSSAAPPYGSGNVEQASGVPYLDSLLAAQIQTRVREVLDIQNTEVSSDSTLIQDLTALNSHGELKRNEINSYFTREEEEGDDGEGSLATLTTAAATTLSTLTTDETKTVSDREAVWLATTNERKGLMEAARAKADGVFSLLDSHGGVPRASDYSNNAYYENTVQVLRNIQDLYGSEGTLETRYKNLVERITTMEVQTAQLTVNYVTVANFAAREAGIAAGTLALNSGNTVAEAVTAAVAAVVAEMVSNGYTASDADPTVAATETRKAGALRDGEAAISGWDYNVGADISSAITAVENAINAVRGAEDELGALSDEQVLLIKDQVSATAQQTGSRTLAEAAGLAALSNGDTLAEARAAADIVAETHAATDLIRAQVAATILRYGAEREGKRVADERLALLEPATTFDIEFTSADIHGSHRASDTLVGERANPSPQIEVLLNDSIKFIVADDSAAPVVLKKDGEDILVVAAGSEATHQFTNPGVYQYTHGEVRASTITVILKSPYQEEVGSALTSALAEVQSSAAESLQGGPLGAGVTLDLTPATANVRTYALQNGHERDINHVAEMSYHTAAASRVPITSSAAAAKLAAQTAANGLQPVDGHALPSPSALNTQMIAHVDAITAALGPALTATLTKIVEAANLRSNGYTLLGPEQEVFVEGLDVGVAQITDRSITVKETLERFAEWHVAQMLSGVAKGQQVLNDGGTVEAAQSAAATEAAMPAGEWAATTARARVLAIATAEANAALTQIANAEPPEKVTLVPELYTSRALMIEAPDGDDDEVAHAVVATVQIHEVGEWLGRAWAINRADDGVGWVLQIDGKILTDYVECRYETPGGTSVSGALNISSASDASITIGPYKQNVYEIIYKSRAGDTVATHNLPVGTNLTLLMKTGAAPTGYEAVTETADPEGNVDQVVFSNSEVEGDAKYWMIRTLEDTEKEEEVKRQNSAYTSAVEQIITDVGAGLKTDAEILAAATTIAQSEGANSSTVNRLERAREEVQDILATQTVDAANAIAQLQDYTLSASSPLAHTIEVGAGHLNGVNGDDTEPFYDFSDWWSRTMVVGRKYTFVGGQARSGHPFRILVDGQNIGTLSAQGDQVEVIVQADMTKIEYVCTSHPSMAGTFAMEAESLTTSDATRLRTFASNTSTSMKDSYAGIFMNIMQAGDLPQQSDVNGQAVDLASAATTAFTGDAGLRQVVGSQYPGRPKAEAALVATFGPQIDNLQDLIQLAATAGANSLTLGNSADSAKTAINDAIRNDNAATRTAIWMFDNNRTSFINGLVSNSQTLVDYMVQDAIAAASLTTWTTSTTAKDGAAAGSDLTNKLTARGYDHALEASGGALAKLKTAIEGLIGTAYTERISTVQWGLAALESTAKLEAASATKTTAQSAFATLMDNNPLVKELGSILNTIDDNDDGSADENPVITAGEASIAASLDLSAKLRHNAIVSALTSDPAPAPDGLAVAAAAKLTEAWNTDFDSTHPNYGLLQNLKNSLTAQVTRITTIINDGKTAAVTALGTTAGSWSEAETTAKTAAATASNTAFGHTDFNAYIDANIVASFRERAASDALNVIVNTSSTDEPLTIVAATPSADWFLTIAAHDDGPLLEVQHEDILNDGADQTTADK